MDEQKTEENKEQPKRSKKISKFWSSCKKNPWMPVSIVLLIVLLLSLIPFGSVTKSQAGDTLVNFLNTKTGGGVTLLAVESQGDLYEVTVGYQGQEIPVYITKDAKYFVNGAEEISVTGDAVASGSESAEVPKSDKPLVELFVWGYCPYGVQAQGPLAEVANLLKGYAEFKIVPYYDGHGAFETQENKIELCIQKLYPDKYWNYAAKFVDEVYPVCSTERTEECDKTESAKVMASLGIDSISVMSCVDSQGDALYASAQQESQGYGVQGSPTLVINGVVVNTNRNSEAFKTAVCNAFTDAPEVCSEVLDSSSAAASGNC